MKLTDFDFRIWNNTKKEYLCTNPTLAKLNGEGIVSGSLHRQFSKDEDYFYQVFRNELELELWTGLYDANDKKIYEGDIVNLADFDGTIMRLVANIDFEEGIKLGGLRLIYIDESLLEDIEIIGNIHENKDLLE
ncbi:TPA: YopX family protein [Campylobacter jejuni]|nr:hypothetical protein [Campylobacter jejuni]